MQSKKCGPQVSTKVVAVVSEPAVVEVPLSTVVEVPLSAAVDREHDDAAPPVPQQISSELFQNEPKSSIEERYPSTGQVQTQRQNEVAY